MVRWPLAQSKVWSVSQWKVVQSVLPELIREWNTRRHLPAVPQLGHALVKGWCENPTATPVRCRRAPLALRSRATAALSSFTLPTQGNPRLVLGRQLPGASCRAPNLEQARSQVAQQGTKVTLRPRLELVRREARRFGQRRAKAFFSKGQKCRDWREVDRSHGEASTCGPARAHVGAGFALRASALSSSQCAWSGILVCSIRAWREVMGVRRELNLGPKNWFFTSRPDSWIRMRRALLLSAVPRTQPGKQALPQEFCVRAGGDLREAQHMIRRGGTRDARVAMWRHRKGKSVTRIRVCEDTAHAKIGKRVCLRSIEY